MKALAGLGGVATLVGGLHASGVLRPGEVYAKPYSVAYAELATMPIPATAAGLAGGGEVDVEERPGQIVWHFGSRAGEAATFIARLSEEDSWHTRVVVDFELGEATAGEAAKLLGTQYMRSTARIAMTEQIAARLEGRPFEQARMGQMLAEHQRAHPEELQQLGNALGDMFKSVAEQARFQADSSAIPMPAGQPRPPDGAAMEAATRPMINPPPQ